MQANGFVADFKDWAASPFSADMPMSHWFYFIGMLAIIVFLWNVILSHLIGAIADL